MKAKIDTGALTSSIHAFEIEEYTEGGAPMVSFSLHPRQRSNSHRVDAFAEVVDRRDVRSSSGRAELRIVVMVEVEVGGLVWDTEFTLTSRDAMGFRMLLGRRAMRGRFVVDPGRSFVTGRPGVGS